MLNASGGGEGCDSSVHPGRLFHRVVAVDFLQSLQSRRTRQQALAAPSFAPSVTAAVILAAVGLFGDERERELYLQARVIALFYVRRGLALEGDAKFADINSSTLSRAVKV